MVLIIYTHLSFNKVSPLGLEIASLKREHFSNGKDYICSSPRVIVTEDLNFAEQMANSGAWLIIICSNQTINTKKYPALNKGCVLDISLNELNLIEEIKEDTWCQSPVSHYQRELIIFANQIVEMINELQMKLAGKPEPRSIVKYLPHIILKEDDTSLTDCLESFPPLKKKMN